MTYVIAEPCVNTKDTACVEVCPVDCIHPKKDEPDFEAETKLYIDPETCIDCGACVPVCPVQAIFPQEELPAYYSAADIFVLGSHHEGSGYALIEACACGAVPVVTRIPAFRAIVGDGARGALWPPGDAIGLANALLQTANRDLAGLRAGLAVHFANELSWTAVGRRALDIYAEVRARRRSSR